MFSFLETVKTPGGEKVIFSGEKLEIFIPKSFFESGRAILKGDKVESIGLYFFKVYSSIDSKVPAIYELQLPVAVNFTYTEHYSCTIKIKPEFPEDTYNVFVLFKGDEFLCSSKYKKNVDDVILFVSKLMNGGKIPSTISYDDAMAVVLNLMDITNTKLGVPSVVLEALLSQIYRDKHNTAVPFRKKYKKGVTSPYAFRELRLTKIPEMTSTFAALTSEDVSHQIIASVLRAREGKPEKMSPIEKVIKY